MSGETAAGSGCHRRSRGRRTRRIPGVSVWWCRIEIRTGHPSGSRRGRRWRSAGPDALGVPDVDAEWV